MKLLALLLVGCFLVVSTDAVAWYWDSTSGSWTDNRWNGTSCCPTVGDVVFLNRAGADYTANLTSSSSGVAVVLGQAEGAGSPTLYVHSTTCDPQGNGAITWSTPAFLQSSGNLHLECAIWQLTGSTCAITGGAVSLSTNAIIVNSDLTPFQIQGTLQVSGNVGLAGKLEISASQVVSVDGVLTLNQAEVASAAELAFPAGDTFILQQNSYLAAPRLSFASSDWQALDSTIVIENLVLTLSGVSFNNVKLNITGNATSLNNMGSGKVVSITNWSELRLDIRPTTFTLPLIHLSDHSKVIIGNLLGVADQSYNNLKANFLIEGPGPTMFLLYSSVYFTSAVTDIPTFDIREGGVLAIPGFAILYMINGKVDGGAVFFAQVSTVLGGVIDVSNEGGVYIFGQCNLRNALGGPTPANDPQMIIRGNSSLVINLYLYLEQGNLTIQDSALIVVPFPFDLTLARSIGYITEDGFYSSPAGVLKLSGSRFNSQSLLVSNGAMFVRDSDVLNIGKVDFNVADFPSFNFSIVDYKNLDISGADLSWALFDPIVANNTNITTEFFSSGFSIFYKARILNLATMRFQASRSHVFIDAFLVPIADPPIIPADPSDEDIVQLARYYDFALISSKLLNAGPTFIDSASHAIIEGSQFGSLANMSFGSQGGIKDMVIRNSQIGNFLERGSGRITFENCNIKIERCTLSGANGDLVFRNRTANITVVDSTILVDGADFVVSENIELFMNSTAIRITGGNFYVDTGATLRLSNVSVSVTGGQMLIQGGSDLIMSDNSRVEIIGSGGVAGSVFISDSSMLHMLNSEFNIKGGGEMIRDESSSIQLNSSRLHNDGALSGGGIIVVPADSLLVVSENGQMSIISRSQLNGTLSVNGLFVLQNGALFNLDGTESTVEIKKGGYLSGNGSVEGGTLNNVAGTISIQTGNFSVQRFQQQGDGVFVVTFSSIGQSLSFYAEQANLDGTLVVVVDNDLLNRLKNGESVTVMTFGQSTGSFSTIKWNSTDGSGINTTPNSCGCDYYSTNSNQTSLSLVFVPCNSECVDEQGLTGGAVAGIVVAASVAVAAAILAILSFKVPAVRNALRPWAKKDKGHLSMSEEEMAPQRTTSTWKLTSKDGLEIHNVAST